MIRVSPTISIDPDEIQETFIRAAGPGGQNVNKVSTAVQLRFDVAASPSLTEPVRRRLMALAGQRLTKEGVLVLTANQYRSQSRNREDALARLVELIREAAIPPKPRIATQPTRSGVEKRLEAKKQRGRIKSMRRQRADGE
ncbi:MAG: aminoacyl-tRNA hydrolase [Hyphomicrobiaceae bacterium]|nr:aminoacyl-tRNA hydrolase [Hyphomicrobiaceae bacterium]